MNCQQKLTGASPAARRCGDGAVIQQPRASQGDGLYANLRRIHLEKPTGMQLHGHMADLPVRQRIHRIHICCHRRVLPFRPFQARDTLTLPQIVDSLMATIYNLNQEIPGGRRHHEGGPACQHDHDPAGKMARRRAEADGDV